MLRRHWYKCYIFKNSVYKLLNCRLLKTYAGRVDKKTNRKQILGLNLNIYKKFTKQSSFPKIFLQICEVANFEATLDGSRRN